MAQFPTTGLGGNHSNDRVIDPNVDRGQAERVEAKSAIGRPSQSTEAGLDKHLSCLPAARAGQPHVNESSSARRLPGLDLQLVRAAIASLIIATATRLTLYFSKLSPHMARHRLLDAGLSYDPYPAATDLENLGLRP